MMYTVKELADRWSANRKTVLNWIREGRLPAIKTPGGHYRISPEVVAEWEEHVKLHEQFNP